MSNFINLFFEVNLPLYRIKINKIRFFINVGVLFTKIKL